MRSAFLVGCLCFVAGAGVALAGMDERLSPVFAVLGRRCSEKGATRGVAPQWGTLLCSDKGRVVGAYKPGDLMARQLPSTAVVVGSRPARRIP